MQKRNGKDEVSLLLVDDRVENLLALEVALGPMDCRLVRATSGREALRCLLHQDFAVILLDVQMPEMDGLETAQLIRGREQTRDIPIIFITGDYGDLSNVSRGYALQAVDYLLKPFDPEILRAKVGVLVDLYRKNFQLQVLADNLEETNQQLQVEIVERTRIEAEIRLQQTLTDLVIGSSDFQAALASALRKICETTGWPYGEVWLPASERSRWECSPIWYSPLASGAAFRQASKDGEAEQARGWLSRVWSSKQPVWLRDLTQETELACAEAASQAGFKAGAGIPLLGDKEVVAVMAFYLGEAQADDERRVELIATVTAQLGLALQYKQMEAALRTHAAKLELSNRDLQEFAYVASHDLQEPLRKVLAFGDRIAKKYGVLLDDTGRDYLKRMVEASQRMQVLINDLLTLSRVATLAQPFTAVDLNVLGQAVVADLEHQIERTQARVDLGALPTLQADPTQIRQVLQNLIGNALKFHPAQRSPIITVSATTDKDTCQISVADNGIGFDIQYLDRIFKPFQRLHDREAYEGSGMGLAICRRIVERHGGSITAASTPGEGSTFRVTLPLRQAEGAK
jgi:signal transduction histidine kinase/DNA-binding response OmpR family regulator